MEIILATSNKHKAKEVSKILRVRLKSLLDLPKPPRIVENGKTFAENALKKARAIARLCPPPASRGRGFGGQARIYNNVIALADDSGLMVDALGGAPGVKSARYAGPNPTSKKLCTKLLRELSSSNSKNRKAKFNCTVAVVAPNGREYIVEGIVHGTIAREMRGEHGFGYDPVFIPSGYKKTFAEMKSAMKNRLSHRGRAFRKVRRLLKELKTLSA